MTLSPETVAGAVAAVIAASGGAIAAVRKYAKNDVSAAERLARIEGELGGVRTQLTDLTQRTRELEHRVSELLGALQKHW